MDYNQNYSQAQSQGPNQNGSHRPWEPMAPASQQQTLPSISTLTSKLPPPVDRAHPDLSINPPQRDSGAWMSNNNSALTASSNNTMPYLSSAHSPNAPGPSPYTPDTTPGSTFGPSLAQTRQQNGALSDHPHRGSGDYDDSRRSSVSGSIHQGMNNLGLGPTSPSPYGSNNQSQSSLVSGLNRERGIPTSNGYNNGRYSTMNGPLSPYNTHRNSRGPFTAGRVAPPILENPKAEVYAADAPTRGQAYAFPDPDGKPNEHSRPASTFSRRGSYAESLASSIVTIESHRYPPGQHELPDSHHHTLVNKQLDSLRQNPDSPDGQTPYSRTPELRVTHKLAERKRRSEMKDCFEILRQRLPSGPTNKSSKWEILSRAIDYIDALEKDNKNCRADADKARHHARELEIKLQQMSDQLQRPQPQSSFGPTSNPVASGSYSSGYQNGVDTSHDTGRTLPPLTNGAMQGVQYSNNTHSTQHQPQPR